MFLRVDQNTVVSKQPPKDTTTYWWDATPAENHKLTTSVLIEGQSCDVTSHMNHESIVEVLNETAQCKRYNTSTGAWEVVSTKLVYPISFTGKIKSVSEVGCPVGENIMVHISFIGAYVWEQNDLRVTGCSYTIVGSNNTGATLILYDPTNSIVIDFVTQSEAEPE